MDQGKPYKQYIIQYDSCPKALEENLASYEHFRSTIVPYCAVTLYSKEQEESLLELLTNMEGVTYREALHRTAMEKKEE